MQGGSRRWAGWLADQKANTQHKSRESHHHIHEVRGCDMEHSSTATASKHPRPLSRSQTATCGHEAPAAAPTVQQKGRPSHTHRQTGKFSSPFPHFVLVVAGGDVLQCALVELHCCAHESEDPTAAATTADMDSTGGSAPIRLLDTFCLLSKGFLRERERKKKEGSGRAVSQLPPAGGAERLSSIGCGGDAGRDAAGAGSSAAIFVTERTYRGNLP